jgi:predicted amidohydrolase YtcJ
MTSIGSAQPLTSVLFRGGHIYSPTDPQATAMLVEFRPGSDRAIDGGAIDGRAVDGRIAWLGDAADAPAADRVVDLDGALVTPAFVDAHVHTTNTGMMLTGLDLSAVRSAAGMLDALARHVATVPTDAVVLGFGFDESTWDDQSLPTPQELDRAAGGRRALLSQASMHSALASPAMLAAAGPQVSGMAGYDPSGWVRRDAHHAVRSVALGSVSAAQRRAMQEAALRHAATLGIAAIHECAGPVTSSEDDLTDVLALGGLRRDADGGLPEVYGYWGELLAAAKAKELGAIGAGGDLFADGALGARTAHLSVPYVDGEPDACGHGYLTAAQVTEHVVDCVRHGMQAGFHAIGDEALRTVVAGYREAAAIVGIERLRDGRHRIEHVEIVDKAIIAGLAELGLVASMQPAFDRLWGGEGQMYEQRLGLHRSLESNPMGALHGVGVALAFGSDSPVTPFDPWGSVRAAVHHHNAAYRMSVKAAFAAHTRGGWRAVHQDDHGTLVPGAPATFAAWSVPAGLAAPGSAGDGDRGVGPGLPALRPDEELPRCRRTVLRGVTIYEQP